MEPESPLQLKHLQYAPSRRLLLSSDESDNEQFCRTEEVITHSDCLTAVTCDTSLSKAIESKEGEGLSAQPQISLSPQKQSKSTQKQITHPSQICEQGKCEFGNPSQQLRESSAPSQQSDIPSTTDTATSPMATNPGQDEDMQDAGVIINMSYSHEDDVWDSDQDSTGSSISCMSTPGFKRGMHNQAGDNQAIRELVSDA